jgi:protease-4
MKQFLKYVLATITGLLLTVVILIITLIIIGSIIAGDSDEVKVKNNSVLWIDFNEEIHDRASKNPLENLDFITLSANKEIGLDEILQAIKYAQTDEKIKTIFLNFKSVPSGFATNLEIRNALINFKKSGKKIIAYSDLYTQSAYFMASVADKVYIHPQGLIELKGLGAQIMFFKGALEKLEVEPQIIRHGKFKSAVEPYMLDKMSDANRLQTRTFMGSLWNFWKETVSKSRNLSVEELQHLADNILVRNAQDAVKYKLADKTLYYDEVLEELKLITGTKKINDIHFIKLSKYVAAAKPKLKTTKNKIAVIFANGEIQDGEGKEHIIGGDRIAKAIREARLDDNVKAVVLRVNSPGGSSLASDIIWREVVLTKKAKPVIVSMGDVAASGGYYISCAADKIFAQPNTITGSIGVFGLMFNGQKLLNNKLGIKIDTVLTGKYGDFGTIYRPLSTYERNVIQAEVEHIYDDFITKVAEGRKLTKAQVDSIGQGRVWSGIDAKKIGLIDEFGGLNDAIAYAVKQAKLDNYRLIDLPKQQDPINQLIADLSGDTQTFFAKKILGDEYVFYKHLKQVTSQQGILMRMPIEIEIY